MALLLETGTDRFLLDSGAQSLSDDFNRADGAIGANWFKAGSNAGPTIVSNQLVAQGTTQGVRYVTPSDSDDQFSQATHLTTGSPQVGVAVAMPALAQGDSPSALPGWYVFHQNTAGGGSRISVKDPFASGFTVLASGGANFASGDVIRLEYVNHVLTAYINGTAVLTYTPPVGTAITGQRYQGFVNNSSGNTGIAILDNWTGGDVAATTGALLEEALGAQYFFDDFNRANGALGSNWAHVGTANVQIASNQVVGGTSVDRAIRWTTPTDTDDQYSQEALQTVSGTASGPALAMLAFPDQTTSTTLEGTYYRLALNSATNLILQQKNIGQSSFTQLASYSGLTINVGDIIRLEYSNHVLYAYQNGALLGSFAPPDPILGQRYVGLSLNSASQSGVPLFDNWAGGDYPRQAAATFTATSTLTADGTQTSGGTTYQGAASLTATSTLTADGIRTVLPTPSLTATSTLTAAGVRTTPGAASLTATSTLTSAAQLLPAAASASLSATSTLTANGVRTTSGAATLTASSTLSATALLLPAVATAALSATETLTTDGVRTTFGAASLTATDTLTAPGLLLPAVASVALTATETLAANGIRTTFGVASLTSTETLAADGIRTALGTAALSAAETLTVDGIRTTFGTVSLTATDTLSSTGDRTTFGTVAFTATETLTTAYTRTTFGAAALSATDTLTANGIREAFGVAALSAVETLSTGGGGTQAGAVAFVATDTLTADGVRTAFGTVALTASDTLSSSGLLIPAAASVALSATDTLTADGIKTRLATTALVATSTLTVAGILAPAVGAANLTAASTLISAGFSLTENVKTDFSTTNPGGIWTITDQGSAVTTITGGQYQSFAGAGQSYYATNNNAQHIIAGSYVYGQSIQVPNVSNGSTYTMISWWKDQSVGLNYFGWLWTNGVWVARERVAGAYSDVNVPAASADAWFRIRMDADGSTIYWDSSADGETWTNRRSKAPGFANPTGAGQIVFQTGNFNAAPSPGTAIWDNLNIKIAAATLLASSTFTANGVRVALGSVALSAQDTLTAVGVRAAQASVALLANGTLVTTGTRERFGTVALTASDTFQANGAATKVGAVSLLANGTLVVVGAVSRTGAVNLAAISTLETNAVIVSHFDISAYAAGHLRPNLSFAAIRENDSRSLMGLNFSYAAIREDA